MGSEMCIRDRLRAEGLNAEVFPGAPKMKKQLQYANRQSIEYVALVGQSEYDRGAVLLKSMTTGEQEEVAIEALSARVKGGDK